MHTKCYFLLNYRTHYCDDSANIATISSLKSNKTAHKILIAAQKFKKYSKNINLFVFVRKFLIKTILSLCKILTLFFDFQNLPKQTPEHLKRTLVHI